jgi:hypothetical protein
MTGFSSALNEKYRARTNALRRTFFNLTGCVDFADNSNGAVLIGAGEWAE